MSGEGIASQCGGRAASEGTCAGGCTATSCPWSRIPMRSWSTARAELREARDRLVKTVAEERLLELEDRAH